MKNLFKTAFMLSIVFVLIGTLGCKRVNDPKDDPESQTPKAKVVINISDGTGARTALPDVSFKDENYTYKLTASTGTKEFVVFSGKTYSGLKSEFEMETGVYDFELKAYSSGTEVFYGRITGKNLNSGNNSLEFIMYPAKGNTGRASITLELHDGVASVKAGLSTTAASNADSCDLAEPVTLEINHSSLTSIFVNENVPTGERCFAIFYLYDSNGALIGSVSESIYAVYGKTSFSTISADSYQLYTYSVEIVLNKNNAVWADGRHVKLTDVNNSSIQYVLRRDGSGIAADPFKYSASIGKGTYEIYVKDSEGEYQSTNLTINTNNESKVTVDFYTLKLVPGQGVKFTSVSDIKFEEDEKAVLLKGTEYSFTAALKTGYDFDLNGDGNVSSSEKITISANGNSDQYFTAEANFTITVNSETELTSSDAHAIPYTITYVISEVNGRTPNWIFASSDQDKNSNGIPDRFETYTVAEDFALPDCDELTCYGKNLNGWSMSSDFDEELGFFTIESDSYAKNLTLYPVWGSVVYWLEITGTPDKTYYLYNEEFDPSGLTVKYVGSNGTSVIIPSNQYSTNFMKLSGVDLTLTFTYHEVSADASLPVNRATYVFTETPELLTDYSGSYSGTENIPAVYYKFGDWPQTKRDNHIAITKGTASNGYYIGGDGNFYALIGQIYYKMEPIVWRVLNTKTDSEEVYTSTNKAFFFAESCLEATDKFPFYFTKDYSTSSGNSKCRTYDLYGDSCTHAYYIFPSNYKYSTIRAWLNGKNGTAYHNNNKAYNFEDNGFLQRAFTATARSSILTTTVDNSPSSTRDWVGNISETGEGYCSPNTNDKIFLLSMSEITNSDYGFKTSGTSSDSVRKRYRTDYTDGRAYADSGYTHYLLRSVYQGSKTAVAYVNCDKPSSSANANASDKGIVPGMWVKLGEIEASLEVEGNLTKTYYKAGESFDPSGITVTYNGTDGTVTELSASEYTTNFSSLLGCNKTLTISYNGLNTNCESLIHIANYEFTEEPVYLPSYTGCYSGTDEIPAVHYNFGDWPQSYATVSEFSSGKADNGYYIGSDGNYYAYSNSNYFKVEPISWRVLNTKTTSDDCYEKTGRALLFAEYCLESGIPFYGSKGSNRTLDGVTVYSTNWEYSNMRAWLNGIDGTYYNAGNYEHIGFIDQAFSESARERILKTEIDNSPASNDDTWGDLDDVPESYCGNNTMDKVFLLSEKEITNGDYGFYQSGKKDDTVRRRYRSDYTYNRAYTKNGYAHYWLRSQYHTSSYKGTNARYVKEGGNPNNYDGVSVTDKGVVPALWIQTKYVDSLTVTGKLNKTYYMTGETFESDGITVTYYDTHGNPAVLSDSQYSTNFDSITGGNSKLHITYNGITVTLDQLVHRAFYNMTETPVLLPDYTGIFTGTDEIPAVFYKFGDYPQSYAASGVTVSSGTAANGYHIGSDGNYYAYTSDGYCLVEPIVWRVLNTKAGEENYLTSGKALFFAEHCLDSGVPYYYTDSRSANAPYERRNQGNEKIFVEETGLYYYGYATQVHGNNYEYSTIRAFLNGIDAADYHCGADNPEDYNYSSSGFLYRAFTETARGRIRLSKVKNDKDSTTAWKWDAGSTNWIRTCPDTMDKVFLLSLQEITNPDYGFYEYGASDDGARKRYRTNYSEARGVYTKSGFAHYMLRTPKADSDKQNYRYVKEGGNPNNNENVEATDKGIVPAMWVSIGNSYVADESTVTTNPLWVEDPHYAATGSSVTYTKSTELFGLVGEGYNGGTLGPIIVHQATLYTSDEDYDGTPVWLITLSGTETIDGQATGVWTDLQSGTNGDSNYLKNVVDVISNNQYSGDTSKVTANIPEGSNIIISGHSLGGMISQQVAANDIIKENYNVLNIITFGSPLLASGSQEGELHRMCDRSDVVPLASTNTFSDSDAQWLERECEDGGYGEEIWGGGTLTSQLLAAAQDTRDTTGPHCFSYIRNEIWGGYDVLGVKDGTARLVLDLTTKEFYQNPAE